MLYIVLVLVLAALGLLVTALVTGSSLWAWVSIGLSVLAGLLLLVDWLRRRKRSDAETDGDPAEAEESADTEDSEDSADSPEPEDEKVPAEADAEQTALLPAAGELGDPADVPEPEPAAESEPKSAAKAVRDTPPGVEETAPEDLEVVKDLEDEVVVVDEYPRYHLVDCGWLSGRDTIPIGVGEARQLGFTPCARCGPDAVLAAAHR